MMKGLVLCRLKAPLRWNRCRQRGAFLGSLSLAILVATAAGYFVQAKLQFCQSSETIDSAKSHFCQHSSVYTGV